MKYLILSALTVQLTSSPCLGNQAAKIVSQYKIQVEFKNLDKKWLSGFPSENLTELTQKDGTIKMPSLMSLGGFSSNLKIIQEYSVRLGGPIIPCGILFDLNPAFNGETIQVSGTSTLRYPTNKTDNYTASQFVTQENLVDLTLKDGETKLINLDGGGQMLITVTLHDLNGQRISN
jgi:hypothetical protein